jgi:hypothetical protein
MWPAMHRQALSALSLALALVLSACGNNAPVSPTVAPMVRPTSTPRPTVTPRPPPTEGPEATETPEPTETPEATRKPIGTTDDPIAPVEMSDLTEYSHPGDLFTIQVPENWTAEDKSAENLAAVTWSDPAENGLIVVLITPEESELNEEELTTRLQEFVNTFQDEPDFSADDPKTFDDGSVQIVWGYTATAEYGATSRLLINSFIYQNGNKISILMLGVPNDQFDGLKESLDTILGSFTVNPEAEFGTAAPIVDDNLPGGETYDFSDDKGAWVNEETDAVSAVRADGVYTMQIKVRNQYYMSNPDMDIGSEQGIAATVEPTGDARAGVFLRLTKTDDTRDYYACWIDAESHYGCFVSVQDEWTTLQDSTESDVIVPGAPNRVRMTANGDTITFSVNGVELVNLTDDQVAEGRAGLYLENFEDPVEGIYDDVVISSE